MASLMGFLHPGTPFFSFFKSIPVTHSTLSLSLYLFGEGISETIPLPIHIQEVIPAVSLLS